MEPSSSTISSDYSASSTMPPYLSHMAHSHEMTDITIETQVDPHHETTTTTTIIHQPFLIAQECPAPRIISWMKGPSNKSSSRKKKAQQEHHHHHPSRSNNRLRQLIPFSSSRPGDSTESKPAGQITVFSIQVTVLGKVLVPSGPADPLPEDLAGSKKVPAQLVRSETTSYVIHRSFEDFKHLSDMILALQNHHHHHIPKGHRHISPLRIKHPHPGLYQALLKRLPFSNARANQRAFDASSTTHGFDEEGAFERVLEMDQYLEDVWQLLTASASSEQLTTEQYNILQWLKPLSNSTHADGRQMKNRQTTQTQTQTVSTLSRSVKTQLDHGQASALSPVLPSTSSVSSSSFSSPSELTTMEELYRDSAPVHKASSASLPSLCSSLSSENGDLDQDLVEKSLSKGSLPATPDSLRGPRYNSAIKDDDERGHELTELPSRGGSRRHTVLEALQGGDGDITPTKVKRRISLSQVIKSLATVSFHLDPEQKRDSMASPSSPPSPPNGWEDDLYIWNTVTTKNSPRAGAAL
ncbi:MAG: hypothetical protein BYD32DRAFT_437413 [Podila humilis]|nr:MAG: hypothetical protein BYD32DRAFT_437413 [Podila humilis]